MESNVYEYEVINNPNKKEKGTYERRVPDKNGNKTNKGVLVINKAAGDEKTMASTLAHELGHVNNDIKNNYDLNSGMGKREFMKNVLRDEADADIFRINVYDEMASKTIDKPRFHEEYHKYSDRKKPVEIRNAIARGLGKAGYGKYLSDYYDNNKQTKFPDAK